MKNTKKKPGRRLSSSEITKESAADQIESWANELNKVKKQD